GGGDAIEADGAGDQVKLQAVRAEHFSEAAEPLAAEVVHLEQPVLRHGDAVDEEEVVLVFGKDMGNAPAVALDGGCGLDRGGELAGAARGTARGFFFPPGVEFGAG